MKNLLSILFLLSACLQSCVMYVNDPQQPSTPNGRQPWWNDSDSSKVNSNQTTDTISIGNGTNSENNAPQPSPEPDSVPDFVPTSRYEAANVNGVLTFNVYLGWSIGAMETAVLIRDFPAEGGEMIFNIYTNHLSMSMYGFEKFRNDFYIFSDEPPYCGYSSYSLDTQSICKYKMTITPNNTGAKRFCSGYWACNDGSGFYSSFKIILYQSYK